MNTKTLLIAALATAFAGAALADRRSDAELQQEAQLQTPSTTTRAEVISQFLAARADGTLAGHTDHRDQTPETNASTSLTRAEVVAELNAARANGTLFTSYSQRNLSDPHQAAMTHAADPVKLAGKAERKGMN